ncbi:MAG TPA: glycosyltransferase, partial [Verrucomicrobiae bacterium]|nr:glycosyltransferase [Verrucomicrobiae bacterium]
ARRIVRKGVDPGRVVTVPPWSHDDDIRFDPHARELFRSQHGLEGKFVVMYAGNHSPCHPLDTLLEASRRLATDPSVIFCFVGGGSEWRRIGQASLPPNVRMLPYQPREALSGVLSAADLHVVVMGAPFVGLVHPCKIYNLLRIGAPLLYIGPGSGPIAALLHEAERELSACVARPGNCQEVMEQIQHMRRIGGDARAFRKSSLAARYSRANLLPRLIDELEAGMPKRRAAFKALIYAAGDARRPSPASHFTRSVR